MVIRRRELACATSTCDDFRTARQLGTKNLLRLPVLHCARSVVGVRHKCQSSGCSNTIEATTLRKLRTRIIPFIFVPFVIAFVDRINIGFAALTMNKERSPASSTDSFRESSSLATSFSKYRATCCCTSSERVSGLPGS